MKRLTSFFSCAGVGASLSAAMAHPGHDHDLAASLAAGHAHVGGGDIDLVAIGVAAVALTAVVWWAAREKWRQANARRSGEAPR